MPDPLPSLPDWIMLNPPIKLGMTPPSQIKLNVCTSPNWFFLFFSNRYKNCLGEKSIPPTPNASQCQWLMSRTPSFTLYSMLWCVSFSQMLSRQNLVARWRFFQSKLSRWHTRWRHYFSQKKDGSHHVSHRELT